MSCAYPQYAYQYIDKNLDQRPKFFSNIKNEIEIKEYKGHLMQQILINCGRCIGCRIQKSKEWASRLQCELKTSDPNKCYFITLTYNDDNVPISDVKELTLQYEDLQKFNKRLRIKQQRQYNNENIRFYAVGEYGGTTGRPHYHGIYFNLELHDLIKWKIEDGNILYRSKFIEDTWGLGYCTIGEVTTQTINYVARYTLKKAIGQEREAYKIAGIEPEKALMSRKPGIGREYYNNNKEEIYKIDGIYINGKKRIEKIQPSKYFDNLRKEENEEEFQKIKDQRRATAKKQFKKVMKKTDLSEENYRIVKEKNLKSKLNTTRSKI